MYPQHPILEVFMEILKIVAIVAGFISAACWLRASIVKVTREQEVERRKEKSEKKGETPNLAGVSLDGWDMSGTFRAQSCWNSIAAVMAALSISAQALSQLMQNA
ncbi:hypothetical protein [Chromohalobacter sp. 48-RD10]|uniref:hypothetical protein n=1 Tax=Chromohalobacter sp. 48-RD10 TaxID=2994063 RepID=UPI0024682936|nr:hypothetical protein [Chromohalobacter sp. 48-RD10]